MASISITRLRIRRLTFLPGFAVRTLLSQRQLRHSPGFIGGYTALGPRFTFWTVTIWQDIEAMRAFRRSGAHLKAMPKLLDWCDEAAVATVTGETLPDVSQATQNLIKEGRISKVRYPSPAHARGEVWPDRVLPRRNAPIQPR